MKFHLAEKLSRRSIPALLLVTISCTSYSHPDRPETQIAYGTEMAQRGYWHEAKFRFEQALSKKPNDPHIWNNLAVSSEGLGKFTEALEQYKKALELAPGDDKIAQNYARFAEFYSNFARGKVETSDQKKLDDRLKPELLPRRNR